ncbi:hypothetical protein LguiA_011990 [Lonicera macranthoides]
MPIYSLKIEIKKVAFCYFYYIVYYFFSGCLFVVVYPADLLKFFQVPFIVRTKLKQGRKKNNRFASNFDDYFLFRIINRRL